MPHSKPGVPRRLAGWVFARTPVALKDEPFEVFIALLCGFAGVPQVLGVVRSSDSVARLLPELGLRIWGASLVIGAALILAGVIGSSHAPALAARLTMRSIERLGLILLAWPTAIYASSILVVGGSRGLLAAALSLAFAAACAVRAMVISRAHRLITEEARAQDSP